MPAVSAMPSPVDAAVTAWNDGNASMFEFMIEAAHIVGRRVEGETKDLGRRIHRSEDTVEHYAKGGLLWWAMLKQYPDESECFREALDWQYWLALAPLWKKNLISLEGVLGWFEMAVAKKWDYEFFLASIPKKKSVDSEWQRTARKAADIIDDLIMSPAFGVDEARYKIGIKLLKFTSAYLRGMTMSNIIEKIIEDGIAKNQFQAAHIANGLELAKLDTDEKRLERARLYRDWRNAGEEPKVAYQKAIKGEKVEALIAEVLHSEAG